MKFQIISNSMKAFEFADLGAVLATGIKRTGTTPSFAARLAANPKAAVPRAMLWEQPILDGFAGPFYGESYNDKAPCLRYEGWKAYEALSD